MVMTLDEIHKAKLNAAIVKEALKQAEQRLTDVLEIKKHFDSRAQMVLTHYVTVSLFLSGIAGTLYKTDSQASIFQAFVVTSAIFIIGAAVILLSFKATNYGVMGSAPHEWLRRDVLESKNDGVTTMLAYEVYHYQERIAISEKSNALKVRLLNIAILFGVLAPTIFVGLMVCS